VVHENAPELTGGHREEVSAVLPVHRTVIKQLEEQLVYERCRLKSMIRPFSAHVARSDMAQLLIHGGHEFVRGGFVAAAPSCQQSCQRPRHEPSCGTA
jgi:hypothetical protein